jgi:hypothetical protein
VSTDISIRARSVVRARRRTFMVAVAMAAVLNVASAGVSSAVTAGKGAPRPVPAVSAGVGSRMHAGASGAPAVPLAPRFEGLSICTDATGLRIAQGRTDVVSGISYVTIIFVNEGTSNCYLNGTPHTQPVGAGYMPLGPPSSAYFDPSRTGYVVLDAGGGAASTSLGIANASKYYPRSSCTPRKMIGVTLRFSYPADFFFRIGAGPVAVCKKITTTSITGVARGVIFGP